MTLGVCPKTHEILFNITSDESFADPRLFKMAMELLPSSARKLFMDGAGDSREIYKLAERDDHVKIIYGLGVMKKPFGSGRG